MTYLGAQRSAKLPFRSQGFRRHRIPLLRYRRLALGKAAFVHLEFPLALAHRLFTRLEFDLPALPHFVVRSSRRTVAMLLPNRFAT
jgi:hypothetical protein